MKLFFPALDFGLGAVVLGAGFVASFHPDARERGVDKQIGWAEGVGAVARSESRVELANGEIHFGKSMPRFEGLWRSGGSAGEFCERGVGLTQGIIGGGVFDEVLEFVFSHSRIA